MAERITAGVERGPAIEILVDGVAIQAYPGETIAAALMAAGRIILGYNWNQRARGAVCNMGVCYECVVETRRSTDGSGELELQRACMAPVTDGMVVNTTRHRQ